MAQTVGRNITCHVGGCVLPVPGFGARRCPLHTYTLNEFQKARDECRAAVRAIIQECEVHKRPFFDKTFYYAQALLLGNAHGVAFSQCLGGQCET